jgi:predicted dehydrogenase
MTSRPTRAAIVGCGVIAHQHLLALSRLPSVAIVGVCDRSAAAATFCKERYGAGAAYTSLDSLLSEAAPEVVHVLTPPSSHGAVIEACLAAGCHVICEKPLAETHAEVTRLLAAADAAGRVLVESQNYRFNDDVVALQALVDSGRLGTVRHVDVTVTLDLSAGPLGDPNLVDARSSLRGGAVHDMLPHLAYLYLTFADWQLPTSVSGVLTSVTGNPRVGTDALDALLWSGDVRGRLAVRPDTSPDAFRITVEGTRGRAETDLFQPYMRVQGGRNVGKRAPIEQVSSGLRLAVAGFANLRNKVLQHTPYHGLHRMIGDLYGALSRGEPPGVSAAEVSASAELVDRLIALRTGPTP